MPKKTGASLPTSKNIAQHTFANGLRLFVYENFASPAVVLSGYLMAGARDEGGVKHGLAGFMADCLTRGTTGYSYAKLFDSIEGMGANLSIGASMHTSSVFAKGLAEDLPALLDMLAQCLREPLFPADEVEKERAEWITDLEERANNTNAMCAIAFNELLYPPGHPNRNTATIETARAITLEDVRGFHRTYITPRDMVLVLSGAVMAAQAEALVRAKFGDWVAERPARVDMPPVPKPIGVQRKHVPMTGKTQTSLSWGLPALPRKHPDWMACALMNSILGQFGMYGRMGENVRKEEGLVYYIGTRFEGGVGPGAWSCTAGTNPNTVERVVALSRAEVRRIQARRVKPGELEDNQRYFVGTLPLALETNEGIAGQIMSTIRYDLGLDFLNNYSRLVNAVTLKDVQRVAQTWLDADNVCIASAGPA